MRTGDPGFLESFRRETGDCGGQPDMSRLTASFGHERFEACVTTVALVTGSNQVGNIENRRSVSGIGLWTVRRQGFEPRTGLIKSGRFSLIPAVSGCVSYSIQRQCFAYLIASCRNRTIPADCVVICDA